MNTKALALTCFALLAGCSSTPQYDARFGEAIRQVKVAMTVNPNGSAMNDPVAGIDGQAARDAMNRYQQTFKEPPPVVNVINIGGGLTSSGKNQ